MLAVRAPRSVRLRCLATDLTDRRPIRRDEQKNRRCQRYALPLLRVHAGAFRRVDHRTLLEWVLELFFEHHRLAVARDAMNEEDWDGEPSEIDPDDFN
jgi:hypothetical protein